VTDLDAELSDFIDVVDRLVRAVQALVRVQVATYNATLCPPGERIEEKTEQQSGV
jgi:hypothetical protein